MALILIVLSLLLVSPASPAGAQTADSTHAYRHQDTPVARAAPLHGDVKIDGKLDEPAWSEATPITAFTQRDPDEGRPVSERTEVRILIGDDALFVGARLYDREPSKIRRRLVRRDEDLASDFFAISLDSYHDHLTAFRFDVSPAGSYEDAALDSRGNPDFSWDPVWHLHTSMDSEGWTVEMEIPLSQLRYNRSDDAVWGIQLMRWIQRRQEFALFAFTPKREQGDVSRYGHLVGLGPLHARTHLELLPYSLAKGQFRQVPNGNPFHDGSDQSASVGGDLKYRITGNLTLDATVNPDFGQVEVDPAVVNLSTTETFFPEKRPFFVERAELFNFGQTRSNNYFGVPIAFHARRIGRAPQLGVFDPPYTFVDSPSLVTIAGAVKLTGKTRNGWSVGALDAVTTTERAHYLDTLGVERSVRVEPWTNYAVARVRRELNAGNTVIGGIMTGVNRDAGDATLESILRRQAYVGGIDFNHFWAAHRWSLDGYVMGSRVEGSPGAIAITQRAPLRYYQRPDATHLTYDPTRTHLDGLGQLVSLNKIGGKHWLGSLTYQDLTPGFESNDLGYISGTDTRGISSLVTYKEDKPSKLLRSWRVMAFSNNAYNHGGDPTYQGYETQGLATFSNYWTADYRVSWYPPAFDDRLTRGGPLAAIPSGGRVWGTVGTDGRKNYWMQVRVNRSWNDAGAHTTSITPNFSLRPSTSLVIRLDPSIQSIRDMAQYVAAVPDPAATSTFGSRYVFATIDQHVVSLDTRVDWTFSPKLSLQLYLQPFIVSGLYRELKELSQPRSYEFQVYGTGGGTIQKDASGYTIDPDGAGPASAFQLPDPSFNFRSLLGNAVLRWEYRPGSAVFLVWQQNRGEVQPFGDFDFSRDFRAMFENRPENVVALKVTYWMGL